MKVLPEMRQLLNQFIIISGSGKKVGKTFLATALIRTFSAAVPLLALKISPHVHDSLGNSCLRLSSRGFRIFQDMAPHDKNSGQFLLAGASKSFFMETDDHHLSEAFTGFMKECNPSGLPVICESGALGLIVSPGISIFIARPANDLPEHKLNAMRLADLVLPAGIFSTPEIIERIRFDGNRWLLTSQ